MRNCAFHGHETVCTNLTSYTVGASLALVALRQFVLSPTPFLGPDTMYKTIHPPSRAIPRSSPHTSQPSTARSASAPTSGQGGRARAAEDLVHAGGELVVLVYLGLLQPEEESPI